MSNRFEWTRVMHETKRRHLIVLRTELVAPRMQRITLGGADLEGFTSLAPGDHVKAFFPDPSVGEIVTPVIVDGRTQQPEGPGEVIARDYSPFAFRPDGENGPELDLDFVLHADAAHSGPAAAWAANARGSSSCDDAMPARLASGSPGVLARTASAGRTYFWPWAAVICFAMSRT